MTWRNRWNILRNLQALRHNMWISRFRKGNAGLLRRNIDGGHKNEIRIQAGDMIPGIYFCVMQNADGIIKTEKLVLRK